MKKSKLTALLTIGWLSLTSCGENDSISITETTSHQSSESISEEESSSEATYFSTSEQEESSQEISSQEETSETVTSEETTSIDYSVKSVEFLNVPTSINLGETYQLNWVVLPSYASEKSVVFSSSNSSVLSVSKVGVITALSEGTSTVFVETIDGNKIDSCDIQVIIPSPELLRFTNETTEVFLDNTLQLTWEFTPSIVDEYDVEFEVSTPEVLNVDSLGLITPIKEGSSLIIIRNASKTVSDTITITVLPSITDYVYSLLESNVEKEKTYLSHGTNIDVFKSDDENYRKSESFEVANDNQIIIDTNLLYFDVDESIIDYIDYNRYQGYREGDAYYQITEYPDPEDSDYENILIRTPIGEGSQEIDEETALYKSNLYNNGKDSIYGISNFLLNRIDSISSWSLENNHTDSTYNISAYQQVEEEYSTINIDLTFNDENYLTEADFEELKYIYDSSIEDYNLYQQNSNHFSLTYEERTKSGSLEIDPDNYYYSDYSFFLSYEQNSDEAIDVTNIEKGKYIYCIVSSFSPTTASSTDYINFIDSSNNQVISVSASNDRIYCQNAGTTTLTISSVRGIIKTIDVTVVE